MELSLSDALKLGMQHQQAGRLSQAESVYRDILGVQPGNLDALHLLGILEQQRGKHESAITRFRQAILAKGDAAEFWHNLGNSLLATGKTNDAAGAFAKAAALDPKLFESQHNLGAALQLAGRSNEAVEVFTIAIKLNPQSAEAHNNLGLALKDQGEVDAAIKHFERAVELRPEYHHAHSNRLYALHYSPRYDAAAIFTAHREWATTHADAMPRVPIDVKDRSPDRPLRVGYISPDLRDHPVGRALLPLIEHRDPAQFDVICYSDSLARDAIANRLRAGATEWHVTRGLDDRKLANLIREHRIDILIDLTLHMHNNRMRVFAQKPAPVQATFIGYPATTGLSQIDFRITDRFLDPVGQTERFNSETLVRLPGSFFCYVPDENSGLVSDAPVARNRTITFGSFNNPCKMNDEVIETWAEILRAVPTSRLAMFVMEQNQAGERFKRKFAAHGIDPARLSFVSRQSRVEYLNQYAKIDIALDPFPYNGHMTSCDALWMGVPVVSLRGQTSVARGGESLLANLDLGELLARTRPEYVGIASRLAGDIDRVVQFRETLRDRMRSSILCDTRTFARNVYDEYRRMWKAAVLLT